MENSAVTLACANLRCQAANPLNNKYCQKCSTPLSKRYLRALGAGIDAYQAGDLLNGRYLCQGKRILLDTKPGLAPETAEEIPDAIAPYLRLSPYNLHIPQIYGQLRREEANSKNAVWLIEQVPIYSGGAGTAREGQIMPKLVDAWKQASAMRQLNWLWQIAQLWQPLSTYSVGSSLLMPDLLRVEGSMVRLLECAKDRNAAPKLSHLGQFWSKWIPDAHPAIAKFLQQLCHSLIQGQIGTSEALLEHLDAALTECGRWQSNSYQISTLTDSGPTRRRNEDACYPPSGTIASTITGENVAMAIVCDGIGGHEGGDVASNLAIETIQKQVEKLRSNEQQWNPSTIVQELEASAYSANEAISQRNDSEKRQDRRRMGTTLVMGVARAHEIYITHVGDSRAYRITSTGCHQITLDDDLASREVRLGYAIYREAVQQRASGSLVQALGMGSSATLHPTVQRFVLDEDCVFLLCSDGLSDYDRVDQYWEKEILPILQGEVNVGTVSQRLVQLANTQNGHDNATVAVVYCQVIPPQSEQPEVSLGGMAAVPVMPSNPSQATVMQADPPPPLAPASHMKTQEIRSPRSPQNRLPLLLGILGVLAFVGALLAWSFRDNLSRLFGLNSGTTPEETSANSNFRPGEFRQLTNYILGRRAISPPGNLQVIIPTGSILKVGKSTPANSTTFWQVQVCSPESSSQEKALLVGPLANGTKPAPVKSGEFVYVTEQDLVSSQAYSQGGTEQLSGCTSPPNNRPSQSNVVPNNATPSPQGN